MHTGKRKQERYVLTSFGNYLVVEIYFPPRITCPGILMTQPTCLPLTKILIFIIVKRFKNLKFTIDRKATLLITACVP